MIELLILWNIAAARADQQEENTDLTHGIIAAWVMLQILIWPVSMFVLLWKKLGLRPLRALVASAVVLTWGIWLGGESFFFAVGILFVVASAMVVAKFVVDNDA